MSTQDNEPEPSSYYPLRKDRAEPGVPEKFDTWQEEVVFMLRSIRKMLIFFTVITILGVVGGVIGFIELTNAVNNTGSGL